MARLRDGTIGIGSLFVSCALNGATLTVELGGGADYADIQSAVDTAADGDTVLVESGEYVITKPIDFNRLNRPGDPASSPLKNIVLKSEEGAKATVIRLTTWASVVVFSRGESKESTIEGFTLTGGVIGGGVSLKRSSPTLKDCIITVNSEGGVVFHGPSSATLIGCTITGNLTGGVVCRTNSTPSLFNCEVSGNLAGGVLCLEGSSPQLMGCNIVGNHGGNLGGGLFCGPGSAPTLTNCIISGNWADAGGAIRITDSSPTLTNCTISGNAGQRQGGVFCTGRSAPLFVNSIIWGNPPESICGEQRSCLIDQDPQFIEKGVFDFNHWKGLLYLGSVTTFPDFVLQAPDYNLRSGSPAIDAGTLPGAPTTDIEGRPRACGAGVDIGAHEVGDCKPPMKFIRGDSNNDLKTTLSDAVMTLLWLFSGDPTSPGCKKSADADDSGKLDISDPIYVLNYLFLGGPAIADPFRECGADGTVDALDCQVFLGCA